MENNDEKQTFVLEGRIRDGNPWLFVDDVPVSLKHSLRLAFHSPCGFQWGYGGSGPAQAALAVLQLVFGDSFAMLHYQRFKSDVIARQEMNKPFKITIDKKSLEQISQA